MTHEEIEAELQDIVAEADAHFDRLQPALIAELGEHGVSDKDLPEVLAYAHGEYWKQSRDLLARARQRFGLASR